MLKAVLFDAADTLFHVRGSVGDVYARIAAQHGVVVAAPGIEARFRAAFQQMPPLAFPDTPPRDLPQREFTWWKHLVAAVFSEVRFADFDCFFRALFDYFADAEAWVLFPETQSVLLELQGRGLRLAVVSNFDGRLLSICDGLGIAGRFDAVVMSARVGYAKPDPRIFDHALRQLGVEAAAAVHVGDSAREDLAGARAAGLRAVLIRRNGQLSDPDEVRDLRQLVERMRAW